MEISQEFYNLFEQILEAATHETPAIQPLKTNV